MSYESFIAGKFIKGSGGFRRLGQPVIRLAVASVALGVCVMIMAVMIVTGFRNEITNKVSGFSAHIRINGFEANSSYEDTPIDRNQPFVTTLQTVNNVKHIQVYAQKAGILKTETEFEGVVLKGVDTGYDFTFLKEHLTSGQLPALGKSEVNYEALVSANLASSLQLRVGDDFLVYFLEKERKVRKFTVSGIYKTGLAEEFDNIFLFCDLRIVQKLNNWSDNEVAGFEILTKDFTNVEETGNEIYNLTGYEFNTKTIKDIYPQIFNWLDLQNINVYIIIALMILVAGINMISTLLIIILENTSSIGLLKALGANNISMRNIFVRIALYIIGRGLLWGNLIGVTLCYIQSTFKIITLPQDSYYVAFVPVNFTLSGLLLINVLAVLICFLMLIIPSGIISRLSPVKVLQYE